MKNEVKLIIDGLEYSGELTEECRDPFNHFVRIENMKVKSGVVNKYDGGYHVQPIDTFDAVAHNLAKYNKYYCRNSTDILDALKYCLNDNYITNSLAVEYNKQCRDSWNNKLEIKKVIFNDPATIVLWNDNTKTVVKCDEEFDPEKGLAMAIAKKTLGENKSKYYDIFKKWLPQETITVSEHDFVIELSNNVKIDGLYNRLYHFL